MKRQCSRRKFVKTASLAGLGLTAATSGVQQALGESAASEEYAPTWESLAEYRVPEWYEDAKFGIFLHWGVYSVPAYSNEWYPREMYLRGNEVFKYHQKHWGPQSIFGYKDFIPMFRAERWDPERWVELFKTAGAKYVVPVGEHHDGFPMYDCIATRWNAAQMGPHRDVVGELGRAVRHQGLKFGVSSHRAFNWSYYTFEKDFDTSNPRYSGLYGLPHAPTPRINNNPGELRQTVPTSYMQDWYARTVQIVDQYQPDLMWFDFCFEGPEWEPYRQQYAAYYYNRAAEWGRGVVVNYKHKAYPANVAVLDIERGLLDNIRPQVWQTDTSVGWKSWGYIQDEKYKSARQIVEELVDIVSKNGCLLLNVGPKPDGMIPEEAEATLRGIGAWLETNGEAIYGTRPWKVYGEGPNRLAAGQFGEKEGQRFAPEDFRFTSKPGAVYAVGLAWPNEQARIVSLGPKSGLAPQGVVDVRLLGVDEKLEWRQGDDALSVKLPNQRPSDIAYTLKVILKT
ncbi:MAG TPA: alpha-L-fucosidase [Terriglobia bacterium]|nr:alpha-L-fucosidase [Terriglobia bacterium]